MSGAVHVNDIFPRCAINTMSLTTMSGSVYINGTRVQNHSTSSSSFWDRHKGKLIFGAIGVGLLIAGLATWGAAWALGLTIAGGVLLGCASVSACCSPCCPDSDITISGNEYSHVESSAGGIAIAAVSMVVQSLHIGNIRSTHRTVHRTMPRQHNCAPTKNGTGNVRGDVKVSDAPSQPL